MKNLEKYNKLFLKAFPVTEEELPSLRYQRTKGWDSLGHMELMSEMEEAFGVSLETLDVMDFSSYEKGREVLGKYGVEL